MADNNTFEAPRSINTSSTDPVCIDAQRIYDSCADKDCLTDLRVYFTSSAQEQIDNCVNVRIRDCDVMTVLIDIEPVPFHRGFYSVDMTYFFEVILDCFTSPGSSPVQVRGMCISDKKVILYGSEGSVKVFSSELSCDEYDSQNAPSKNLPVATVQVARPIALSATLTTKHRPHPIPCKIPGFIANRIGGEIVENGENDVYVTIGVFSIVQIERNVQMLIPSYDFCIPGKKCTATSDSPCDMFERLDFPTNEFFPPNVGELTGDESSPCGSCSPSSQETIE